MNINWHNIKTVLLDMDGTLLDLHFDNYFWMHHLPMRYAQHHGANLEDITKDLYQRFHKKKGTLEWYCLDYWSQQLDIDIVNLKKEIQHLITERPFVHEFLDYLAQQNIQRILVTNAHPDSLQLKLSLTGIAEKLDRIISSHQYKAPKESLNFWQQLHADIGFDPTQTLFIDDSEDILTSAQQFNIEHLISIRQPDSQKQVHPVGKYPAIIHFDELLPNE